VHRSLQSLSAGDVACDLLVRQQKAKADHDDVRDRCLTHEIGATTPVPHDDQDHEQGQELSDLNAHVERQKVGKKPVFGDLIFEDFRRQTRAVEQSKDQCRSLGIGLEPEPLLEGPTVVECLVNARQADVRVATIGIAASAGSNTPPHGDRKGASTPVYDNCPGPPLD